jgi:hypothetical protein
MVRVGEFSDAVCDRLKLKVSMKVTNSVYIYHNHNLQHFLSGSATKHVTHVCNMLHVVEIAEILTTERSPFFTHFLLLHLPFQSARVALLPSWLMFTQFKGLNTIW